MNRSWSGFLPQNEIVRLQWAALEFQNAEALLQRIDHLKKIAGEDRVVQDGDAMHLKVLQALDAYMRKLK